MANEIDSVTRQLGARVVEAGEARVVTISRTYDTDIDDLWSACTEPERLARWFLPVTGDLRLGGRYQFEGNAGGTIQRCDPPKSFAATWEYGGGVSWVEVQLAPDPDGGTKFELSHSAVEDEHWAQFGPGAAGVGWDISVRVLGLYLAGQPIPPEEEWAASPEGIEFSTLSSERWCAAYIAAGADPAAARAAADRTTAFYTSTS